MRLETRGSLPCLVTVPFCSRSLLEVCSSSSLAGLLERVVRAASLSFASGLYILKMRLVREVCFKERVCGLSCIYVGSIYLAFLETGCCMTKEVAVECDFILTCSDATR